MPAGFNRCTLHETASLRFAAAIGTRVFLGLRQAGGHCSDEFDAFFECVICDQIY
jgi:hypothetical protein